jgi:hypothetical protein
MKSVYSCLILPNKYPSGDRVGTGNRFKCDDTICPLSFKPLFCRSDDSAALQRERPTVVTMHSRCPTPFTTAQPLPIMRPYCAGAAFSMVSCRSARRKNHGIEMHYETVSAEISQHPNLQFFKLSARDGTGACSADSQGTPRCKPNLAVKSDWSSDER